jgi:Anti-sigma-K factor rskA/Putative zinc-finger
MGAHEEFLELCAAATAGELSAEERAKLDVHLASCSDCRSAMREYEVAIENSVPALAPELARNEEAADGSWSVEDAEKTFFKKLDREQPVVTGLGHPETGRPNAGQRFTYRPSQFRWREVWIPFAAAVLLALALGITLYKTGLRRGMDAARTPPPALRNPENSLEAQASDAGHERAKLMVKLAEGDKVIEDLKRKLSQEARTVTTLQSANSPPRSAETHQLSGSGAGDSGKGRDEELAAARGRLADLQKALDMATAERGEAVTHSAVLEAKVSELTQLMRERQQALDQNEAEVAKQQELLEHDRDIRELMGARELYMADVHDVTRAGTNKTYGRVFYTKGKSLIFYAFDLDAQAGLQNASSFQAWGRRGPDKQEARSLGIFYEDNVSKKRWVLKADDPKSLQDIDAVFVTAEPNGGSPHPSGKQLLFAYLRINPNHP